MNGKETSLNPLGLVEALLGAMSHAAQLELDAKPDDKAVQQTHEFTTNFAATLRLALHNTFRYGQGTRDMNEFLRMKGVQAEYHVLSVDSGQTGPALIVTAERSDIALVVMGAVSQFNVRTRVVGGVTRFMLEKSTVPLLLSN